MLTFNHLAGPRSRRSPHVAALLSFLWPGLGQWYAGRVRAAALFALPVLGILALIALQAVAGVEQLVGLLITPSSALTIVILVALLGLWRLVSIADSMIGFGTRAPWRRGRTSLTFGALALAVIVMHLSMGYVAWAFYDAGSRIFVGDNGPDQTPRPTTGPDETPSVPDEYAVTPDETPPTPMSRINILLTGVDSAEDRSHALTDTLIVASIDPETNAVALISFPRDISNFRLSDGRLYRGKINSLMTYARLHPSEFPDGPLPTLVNELGYLLGVPIHYYAALDLEGFRRMIDLVGGVTVDNPRAINDPRYRWLDGHQGFTLSAGPQNLDGVTALAYVRSRQGLGDNDFTRARRQQQVLVALRAKLTSPEMLPQLTQLLDTAGDTIRTNFPSDRIAEMIDLATRIDDGEIFTAVLGPPYSTHPPSNTTGGIYTLRLDLDKVAELSIRLFGADSTYASR